MQERVKLGAALKAEMEKKIKNVVFPPAPAATVALVQVSVLLKLVTGMNQQKCR